MVQDRKTLVVVVSYNGLFFMQANIKSIRNTLAPGTYKIAVVDNASTDGVAQWLEEQEDILFIRNSENVGFGPACNQAVNATVGTEYGDYDVFLLNNDTRMVKGALESLRSALYSAPDIGAVGSVSNYAGNKQALDIGFDSVEDYVAYGEKLNVPMENPMLERVRLCGFAMLIRRNVWDEVGGFDEDFVPGYYEDDALSMEILRLGYRLEVVRNSFIYHAGSESFIKTDYNSAVQRNYRLFIQKYGFDIMRYAYASGTTLSAIPFGRDEHFGVLHYGCGLGSELKAIRSLYPNSSCAGIESNGKIFDIAVHTEKIYRSIDELKEAGAEDKFKVLIVEKSDMEAMSGEEKKELMGLLADKPVILIKNRNYEEIEFERVKQVIWNTGAVNPADYPELVKSIADHGMINSLETDGCDPDSAVDLLGSGIEELFVFENPGREVSESLEYKAENVLKITDAEMIPYLTTFLIRSVPRDTAHRELSRCRILDKKMKERKLFSLEKEFLKNSDIRITINRNCLEELESVYNLVVQGKQMSVGQKWAEKEILTRLCTNDWNDSGYVRVRDKYGDYGIAGFYCFNQREKTMEYFVFSRDIAGMGIDRFVLNVLGCERENLDEDYRKKLSGDPDVSWIQEDKENEVTVDRVKAKRADIFLKGSRFAKGIEPYLSGGNVTIESDDKPDDSKLFSKEYRVICMEYAPADVVEENGEINFEKIFEGLENLCREAKGKPCIILLLREDYGDINPMVEEFAEDTGSIRTIYANAKDAGEFYDLAGEICGYINEAI